MKKSKLSIVSIVLSSLVLLFSGCQGASQSEVDVKLTQAPDYSKYTEYAHKRECLCAYFLSCEYWLIHKYAKYTVVE